MSTDTSTPALLVHDVARMLDTTPQNVRRLVAAGQLQPSLVTVGGVRLFDVATVERVRVERAERRASATPSVPPNPEAA